MTRSEIDKLKEQRKSYWTHRMRLRLDLKQLDEHIAKFDEYIEQMERDLAADESDAHRTAGGRLCDPACEVKV